MIKSLSSLRFIFAILVFLVHIEMFNVAIGHAFFIILSGFILSLVYEQRILHGEMGFRDFFRKRIIRIYPLYVLTLLISIPLSLYDFHDDAGMWTVKLVLSLFSLQTFIPDINTYFSFNGVAWNAADLLIFYACFPFLVFLFSKLALKHFTLLILVIILGICISMTLVDEKYYHYVFYISPYLRIFDFIFGMFLYKIAQKIKFRGSYTTASVLEIVVLLFLALWFLYANLNYKVMTPFIYSVYLWVPISLVIVVFYFDAGIISKKILATKLMYTLGGLSFSFYMVHHLIIRYVGRINDKFFMFDKNFAYYLVCFLLAVVAAWLINRYFEKIIAKKLA